MASVLAGKTSHALLDRAKRCYKGLQIWSKYERHSYNLQYLFYLLPQCSY